MFKPFIEQASEVARASQKTERIIFLNPSILENKTSSQEQSEISELNMDIRSRLIYSSLDKNDLDAVARFSNTANKSFTKLCETHQAKIVIASYWGSAKTLEQTKVLFYQCGWGKFIIDKIHYIEPKYIQEWLEAHATTLHSFVILTYPSSKSEFLCKRFGERYLHSQPLHYESADNMLTKKVSTDDSPEIKILASIENNTSEITRVVFNSAMMSVLKIVLGHSTKSLFMRIFSALENNTHITHLSFNELYEDETSLSQTLLKQISRLLAKSKMPLEYLNLAANRLSNIQTLLEILDGKKKHIKHICLNANPIEINDQVCIAKWLQGYPLPLHLEFDLSNSNMGIFTVNALLIHAVAMNPMITLSTKENLITAHGARLDEKELRSSIEGGRLLFDSEPTRSYGMKYR